jgi:hypothetical protein
VPRVLDLDCVAIDLDPSGTRFELYRCSILLFAVDMTGRHAVLNGLEGSQFEREDSLDALKCGGSLWGIGINEM